MSITLRQMVYDIKNIAYGGLQSDDAKLSDRQIAYWIKQQRARLIKQELSKKTRIPESYIQHIPCLELELVNDAECCQTYNKCKVLRSKLPIPTTITRGGKSTIVSVSSVDGMHHFSETTFFKVKTNKYAKYTGDLRRWFLKDDYLYITNDSDIKRLAIAGVFEDPEELSNFVTCEDKECFTEDSEFPITMDMAGMVTSIILQERLGIIKQMPTDTTNNAIEDAKIINPNRQL